MREIELSYHFIQWWKIADKSSLMFIVYPDFIYSVSSYLCSLEEMKWNVTDLEISYSKRNSNIDK